MLLIFLIGTIIRITQHEPGGKQWPCWMQHRTPAAQVPKERQRRATTLIRRALEQPRNKNRFRHSTSIAFRCRSRHGTSYRMCTKLEAAGSLPIWYAGTHIIPQMDTMSRSRTTCTYCASFKSSDGVKPGRHTTATVRSNVFSPTVF